MRLSMTIPYAGDIRATADLVVELEHVGLDIAVVPEAYSYDAISMLGYLAARTTKVQLATGIINVYGRSPATIGMTAAGLDYVSDGRFTLGLGASGPQVIEGFHGLPYTQPLSRMRDVTHVVRKILRREVLTHAGEAVRIPLPESEGSGLAKPLKLINHPVRPAVPIWWAALMDKSVATAAELADGWLPTLFVPERSQRVWGDALQQGLERRDPARDPLDIVAGGPIAVNDPAAAATVNEGLRRNTALYVGGMGARTKNFYNTLCQRYGWVDEAVAVQDLYLSGRKEEAERALPREFVEAMHLAGPAEFVSERVAAYRAAGVTTLAAEPVPGTDPVAALAALRSIVDA